MLCSSRFLIAVLVLCSSRPVSDSGTFVCTVSHMPLKGVGGGVYGWLWCQAAVGGDGGGGVMVMRVFYYD